MLSRTEILTELTVIFEQLFEVDPSDVREDARLYEDLDIDSIDAVDLIVKLKDWTGEKVAPEEFKNVRTVNDVIDAIEELLSRGA